MKTFRKIYLITLGVLSLIMGIIGATQVHELWAGVILLTGTIGGALGMFLIVAIEANPCRIYNKPKQR